MYEQKTRTLEDLKVALYAKYKRFAKMIPEISLTRRPENMTISSGSVKYYPHYKIVVNPDNKKNEFKSIPVSLSFIYSFVAYTNKKNVRNDWP